MSDRTDLHLHSTFSDGVLSPDALVAELAASGIEMFALTDHDTVDGLDEAARAARAHGLDQVPGVELSASWRGRTIHVLGLGIDPNAKALSNLIGTLQTMRWHRVREIARRLERAGVPGADVLSKLDGTKVPTRSHVARALVALGAIDTLAGGFDRWLGHGKPAYVSADWPDLGKIVSAVVAAGGVAVIAHPLRYKLSAGQRRQLLTEFREAGGTAIEVISGNMAPHQVETSLGLALRTGLEGSVGSDCHDPTVPWHRLGRLAKLPPSVTPVWSRWRQDHTGHQ
jgi:hypothetical protein